MNWICASIRWTTHWSPWIIIVVAIASGVAVGLYYLRETKSLPSMLAYLLPALRSVAVAMTILTLAAPVWHRETVVGTLGKVILAVDASASMSTTETQTGEGPSRYQQVAEDLTRRRFDGVEGLVAKLSASHDVSVVTFSDGPVNQISLSEASDGQSDLQRIVERRLLDIDVRAPKTDLTSPLQLGSVVGSELDRNADGPSEPEDENRPVAIVMLSDGRDTAGRSASKVLPPSVTVHTIGYGSPSEPMDLGIVSVAHPETVAVDGKMVGSIDLKRTGFE